MILTNVYVMLDHTEFSRIQQFTASQHDVHSSEHFNTFISPKHG